tara:strand:+ start:693 stop:2357 length:1665 start_codon:yes stop_codon:yes gene_type:complete
MADTPKTIFDSIHLASVVDGDWRIDQLNGLARLSPYLFIGSNRIEDVRVTGYYNCNWLAHFRVAVRGMLQEGSKPTWQESGSDAKDLPCPNLFDLDTRTLYFGQKDQSPEKAVIKPMEEGDPGGEWVAGAPMRIRQLNFRAFNPQGESDEYSAWFLATNPVGKREANASGGCSTPSVTIDSDFAIERSRDDIYQWSYNNWTVDGNEATAVEDFEARMIVGDPLVSEADAELYWESMFSSYNDLCPNPKNNTFKLRVDSAGLIVRQECATDTIPGWHYKKPFDIIVANRWRFYLGDHSDGTTTCPPLNEDFDGRSRKSDHFEIEYYNEGDVYKEDKILRRPDLISAEKLRYSQYSAQAIGNIDGINWEAIPSLLIPDFCDGKLATPNDRTQLVSVTKCGPSDSEGELKDEKCACDAELERVTVEGIKDYVLCELAKILDIVVTDVYATDCGIKYDYVDLNCEDGEFSYTKGTKDVIDFTNCDGTPCVDPGPNPRESSSSVPEASSSAYPCPDPVPFDPTYPSSIPTRETDCESETELAIREPGEEGCPRTDGECP